MLWPFFQFHASIGSQHVLLIYGAYVLSMQTQLEPSLQSRSMTMLWNIYLQMTATSSANIPDASCELLDGNVKVSLRYAAIWL